MNNTSNITHKLKTLRSNTKKSKGSVVFKNIKKLIEFNRKTSILTNIFISISSGMTETNLNLVANTPFPKITDTKSKSKSKSKSMSKSNSNKTSFKNTTNLILYNTCSILYRNRFLPLLCELFKLDHVEVESKIEEILKIRKVKSLYGGGLSKILSFLWNMSLLFLIVYYSICIYKNAKEVEQIYSNSETRKLLMPLINEMNIAIKEPNYIKNIKSCVAGNTRSFNRERPEYRILGKILDPLGFSFSTIVNNILSLQSCMNSRNDFTKTDIHEILSIEMGDNNEIVTSSETSSNSLVNVDHFLKEGVLTTELKSELTEIYKETSDNKLLMRLEGFIDKFVEIDEKNYNEGLILLFGDNYVEKFDSVFCKSELSTYENMLCVFKSTSSIMSLMIGAYTGINTGKYASLWLNIRNYFSEKKDRLKILRIEMEGKYNKVKREIIYFKEEITRMIGLLWWIFFTGSGILIYFANNYLSRKTKNMTIEQDNSVSNSISNSVSNSISNSVSKETSMKLLEDIDDDIIKKFSVMRL